YLSPYSTSRANHEHLRRPALQPGPCPGPGDGANAGGRAGTGASVPRQRPAARRDGGARHARVRGRAAAGPPLARLGGAGDGAAGGAALSGGRLAGLPQAAGRTGRRRSRPAPARGRGGGPDQPATKAASAALKVSLGRIAADTLSWSGR